MAEGFQRGSQRRPKHRLPNETEEEFNERLQAQQALMRHFWEVISDAVIEQGLTFAEVSERLGLKSRTALAGRRNSKSGITAARMSDIGRAIGVDFRLIAVPNDLALKRLSRVAKEKEADRLYRALQRRGALTVRDGVKVLYDEFTSITKKRTQERLDLLFEQGRVTRRQMSLDEAKERGYTGISQGPYIYEKKENDENGNGEEGPVAGDPEVEQGAASGDVREGDREVQGEGDRAVGGEHRGDQAGWPSPPSAEPPAA